MPEPKTSWYYDNFARYNHPEITAEQAASVIENPDHVVEQDDGKLLHYGRVTFMHEGCEITRYARVITLADGETLQNAFIDHAFTDLMRSFDRWS